VAKRKLPKTPAKGKQRQPKRKSQPKLGKASRSVGTRPTQLEQRGDVARPNWADVEKAFPAVAEWVNYYGHIEIGDQEGFGFIVRALDYGGLVFEDDTPETFAEAMAALEKALAEWFVNEGIER
jgi:hypothetical protein